MSNLDIHMVSPMGLDPIRKSLLDFIAIRESAGNYDAFIGHANNRDPLDGNTINGIYMFQRKLLSWGEPSSAVGRYQFIQKTLNALVQQAGVALTDRFTHELQDRFASMLLDQRGYGRWLAGDLSDEDFAHNLSCEWASLPDPQNDGKSHYDGVGPNHAGQTLDAVYAALAAARKLTVA